MMKRMALGALLAGMLSLLGACQGTAELNAIAAKARTMMTAPEYVIGEGDTVTINVLDHERFLFTGLVRPDGKVSFPQHGDIVVAGKTAEQLRTTLPPAFKDSLGLAKDPKVYVSVTAFTSKAVTILGEVARPGRFPYMGQMRVADLLGLAVGAVVTSAPNRTVLFREVDGATKIYSVKLKDFLQEGDFTTNFYLRPGDIVYVPMNPFAKAASGITKVTAPLAALFGIVGIGSSTTAYFVPGGFAGG